MNGYLRAAISGEMPSVADWHEYLREFHRRVPDATSLPMSLLRSDDGRTSVERFAAFAHRYAPVARDVLDVGCGDGMLLEELRRVYSEALRLSGIDLSDREIARARERLPDAHLVAGDFASAEYPPRSFDLISGHLSFALMPDTRSLFGRAASMLRAGGALAFATENPRSGDSFVQLSVAPMAAVRKRYPKFAPLIPDRDAIEDDALVKNLLRECGFDGEAAVERFAVHATLDPDEAWQVLRRTYVFGLLPADVQSEARAALAESMDSRPLDVSMTIRTIVARR